MPVDKQVMMRYQVLNKCFRNRYRDYTIDDLVEENNNFAVVTINVKLNKELEALVLSYGSDMEVLSPDSFRARIVEKVKIMNQKYTKK